MVNEPSEPVTAVFSPWRAGLVATTTAPTTGLLVEPSVTTPVITPVDCADATPAQSSSAIGTSRRRFSRFFLMVTFSLERCDEAETGWSAAVPPSERFLRTGFGNVNYVLRVGRNAASA